MSLVKLQKDVDKWINQYTTGYFKPLEILTRLTEEVGELARELNHVLVQKRKSLQKRSKRLLMKLQIFSLPLFV